MPAAVIRLAGNEGVGEHVRTKFRTGRSSGETAAPPLAGRIRTERRKLVSSTGPASGSLSFPRAAVQPLDLMSRRHPLSSIGAQGCSIGSNDVPAKSLPAFSKSGETYFFFLATLRVFFAVFFTALFAFFAFFAFLAIVPSDK